MRPRNLARNIVVLSFRLLVIILVGLPIGWLGSTAMISWFYLQALQNSASQLHTKLSDTTKTTKLAVFSDAGASAPNDLQSITSIEGSIQSAQEQLRQFSNSVNGLTRIRYASVLPYYHQALFQQSNAQAIVAQTQDVLSQYDNLASFLKIYFTMNAQFAKITGQINSIQNFSSLSGSGDELVHDQQTLNADADKLASMEAPYDFQPLVTQSVAFYRQAANGIGQFTDSFATGNDQEQQSGIANIEQATHAHDALLSHLPATTYANSYTLQEVNELTRKTDSILAANTSGD